MNVYNLVKRLNRIAPQGKPAPKSMFTFAHDKAGSFFIDPATGIAYTPKELERMRIRPLFTPDNVAAV